MTAERGGARLTTTLLSLQAGALDMHLLVRTASVCGRRILSVTAGLTAPMAPMRQAAVGLSHRAVCAGGHAWPVGTAGMFVRPLVMTQEVQELGGSLGRSAPAA